MSKRLSKSAALPLPLVGEGLGVRAAPLSPPGRGAGGEGATQSSIGETGGCRCACDSQRWQVPQEDRFNQGGALEGPPAVKPQKGVECPEGRRGMERNEFRCTKTACPMAS
ncbi:MAG: hypothetical protein DDG59_10630 [Anaerolineae bacterium]|nr:MAG: hypothetical protein DDG59_10630 [Anaerolineae bacterium]